MGLSRIHQARRGRRSARRVCHQRGRASRATHRLGPDVPAELVQEAADEVTKETLQAECDLRGVEYDRRWGVARLQEALAAAE